MARTHSTRAVVSALVCAGSLLFALAPAAQERAATAHEPAQPVALALVDGTLQRGIVLGSVARERGLALRFHPDGAPAERELPLSEVLTLHGAPPQPSARVRVRLAGGDELRGELRAGDADGESFTLWSDVLGERRIPVDRLAVLEFLDRIPVGSRPRSVEARRSGFAVPADTASGEAVFRRAQRGFDMVVGEIHRFADDGVVFKVGAQPPALQRYDELSAIALREGSAPAIAADAWLLTRGGDHVGVGFLGATAHGFRVRLEDGAELELPSRAVCALTFLDPGRRFLSSLEPIAVDEHSYFAESGETQWPFARDRAVTGEFLAVGGLASGVGIGVHSRSRLTWRVPDGFTHFVAMVGLDDSVRDLAVRPDARIVVRVDDVVVLERDSLRGPAVPEALGRVAAPAGATLTLEVDFGAGLDLGDRVDWLAAAFVR